MSADRLASSMGRKRANPVLEMRASEKLGPLFAGLFISPFARARRLDKVRDAIGPFVVSHKTIQEGEE